MTQQKPAKGSAANRPQAKAEKPPVTERYLIKPEVWESLLDSLPPWGDEIAAIVLIVFGVVSFLSLFNVSSDATIAAAWSNALTQLFGFGSVIVAGGIFGLGIVILLPKLGLRLRFPAYRILALEIAFLSVLALMHLAAGDAELRALARAGRGGGYVGWALSSSVSGLFGSVTSITIYSILFIISIGAVIGLRRSQIVSGLQRLSAAARNYGQQQLTRPVRRQHVAPPPISTLDEALAEVTGVTEPSLTWAQRRLRTGEIMRIRPNFDHLPPSLRPDASRLDGAQEVPATKVSGDKPEKSETSDLPRRAEPLVIAEFNAVGALKGKKAKDGKQVVIRPDGREKHYFYVEDMKEQKRVGRRKPDLPPLELLRDLPIELPDEQEINTNVVLIENTLLEFDIDVDIVDVKIGPTVTQYGVQPFKEITTEEGLMSAQNRTRINKIASLTNDLALTLSAKRLRMELPVPGKSYIGIEVPNKNPSVVALRSVYESRVFYEMLQKAKTPLMIPLGRDVSGAPVAMDIGEMPHVLIAGTTGSGKSVAIAAMATALVINNMPDNVKLVMLDPKMVELSRFNGLPHLLGPVETDQDRIIGVLRWCTREMDRRYKLLEEAQARNISTYNGQIGKDQERLPYIVILIDEIGDLMLSRPEETEQTVTRLAQMARAVGMHLVVATQRPSVDIITGLIKANFPSRVSFAVASGVDSRVILDTVGAETLMGRGDMLYFAPDAAGPKRLQGCYVSDDEVRAVVEHWKKYFKDQIEKGKMQRIYNGPWERALTRRELLSETDPMLEDAIELCIAEGEASASLIQRKLNIGYPRAARIMDMMEELGMIGEPKAGGRSRTVLIQPGQDPFKDIIDKRTKNV